ncbi:MAG: ABC transporter permease [Bryobacteraceae bacterium]|nr:ABC transporter permease [Bryobacteraceae bacterium]
MTRAELHENLMVALDTLRSHKVRSALTILGIVIGVTSVISVASIIDGLNGYIQHRVEEFGSRTYFVSRIPLGPRFGRMPEHIRKRKYFQATDAEMVRQLVPHADNVSVFGTRAFFFGDSNDVRYGSNSVERVILRGAEPSYFDAIPLFAVSNGRAITKFDEEHSRPVVVLGAAVADSLFKAESPLGKMVRVNGQQYEVIGVFEHDPGLFGGPGVDSFVVMPFSLFHKRYPESKELILGFTVPKGLPSEQVVDDVTNALRRARKVGMNAQNDFEITAPDFLTNLWNQLTGALVLLTSIISSVGLMVGGIGVMNIMLISVTERTAEIGVRKAIGARKSDIRAQFLLEAVLLSVVGGAIGIALGALFALVVRTVMPSIPATVSPVWVTLGVAISVGVGIFFGYYPANRAANLDPIVCLRYE